MKILKGEYLTTAEAGDLIGRGMNMMIKLCQQGRLPGAEKMGGCWIIPRESVLKYKPKKRGNKTRAERKRQNEDLKILNEFLNLAKNYGK